jgi:cellulose synthase operon protein C
VITLVFPSQEALQLALTSSLVPSEVQAAPARFHRAAEGTLLVTSEVTLEQGQLKALLELGVRAERHEPALAAPVSCWAEVIAARRLKDTEAPGGPVLFLPEDEGALLPLAGEMLRLGCDRQELCLAEGRAERRALLRAVAPPYFTLTRALERTGHLRAFVPAVPGQHSVWVELGYTHTLARTLRPAAGSLLLIPSEGPWLHAPDGPWLDLYQLVDLRLPEPAVDWAPRSAPGRLAVPLRLARAARSEPASLWVLRENAVAQVEALVNTLPEALLAQLRFAVSGPPESPCIVLRARPGREQPPELGLSGTAHAPLSQLLNLYLPCESLLEPPLRRDRLRALLAPEPDMVTWLHPTGQGAFRTERLPDNAFHPLEEWVEYVIDTAAMALEPWVRGATFDFAAFEAAGGTWQEEPSAPVAKEEPKPKEPRRSRRSERASAPVDAVETPVPEVTRAPRAAAAARLAPLSAAQVSATEQELAELERAFLALESPADAPERQHLWIQMAELNGRLGRKRDASLCWTRVLWEASGSEAASIATHWADAEAPGIPPLPMLLGRPAPTADEVRALASQVVEAALVPGEALDVPVLQRWLDRHDEPLDVRSLWLTRSALARLAGGDPLGLARAGDRLLSLLHRGLSLARDVPAFLRGGMDAALASRLRNQLEALLQRFDRTPRKRSAIEAAPALTHAYVRFVFAYGLARLGHADQARSLATAATSAVEVKDPIHGFLTRAYGARVAHALEGQPPEVPLPAEIAAELNALSTFNRYKVDRLRQSSVILEPSERLDPMRAYGRGARDLRGEEFAALRDLRDTAQVVAAALEQLTSRATSPLTPVPERQRLAEGLLDSLPRLPPARALPLLSKLVPALEGLPAEAHALLLSDALTVASHFGRTDHVTALAGRLRTVLAGLAPEAEAWSHGTLGACLLSLRRAGLMREAEELIRPGLQLLGRSSKAPLPAQLGVAAGLAMLGRMTEASPVFERATKALSSFKGGMPERLSLTRSIASAVAHAPLDDALPALAGLSEQLPVITDSYNTNSHFCLSVVELADALVLGHVSAAQGATERVRHWLDEDELLVRRRVHQELEG